MSATYILRKDDRLSARNELLDHVVGEVGGSAGGEDNLMVFARIEGQEGDFAALITSRSLTTKPSTRV